MTDPMLVWVERLPEPKQIWDLRQLFSTMVYGYLHLGNVNKILESSEQVDALEALLDTVRAAAAYRNLLPVNEHMALVPGSKSRTLAVSIDRMQGLVSLAPGPPDANCETAPDGSCVSEKECMHSQPSTRIQQHF